MPLTSAEKTAILGQAQTLASSIENLTVDPDPHPLQVALDQANAALAQANTALAAMTEERNALQGKIDAAKAAIEAANAADATEDAARNAALQHLG